jgi:hypothetical protein
MADKEGEGSPACQAPGDAAEQLRRFKNDVLGAAVMDEQWETMLVWADARTDIGLIPLADRDEAVIGVLMELFDEGLLYFIEITSFAAESYARAGDPSEALSRERLLSILTAATQAGGAPTVGIRATGEGRESYFRANPDKRARWLQRRL